MRKKTLQYIRDSRTARDGSLAVFQTVPEYRAIGRLMAPIGRDRLHHAEPYYRRNLSR